MDQPIREDGPHLAAVLQGRLAGDGPLYLRLSTALRQAIDRGEIAQGTLLPPERTLARELAVSRSTIVAAYDRLKVEGWLDSRQGSGTWVRRPPDERGGLDAVSTGTLFLTEDTAFAPTTGRAPTHAGLGPLFRSGTATSSPSTGDIVDLSVGAAPAAPAITEVIQSLTAADLDPMLGHHGYVPHGLGALRERVAARFGTLGLPTHPDQVVITNGAHQALSLLARQLVSDGDTVLVESPTFPGALDVFRRFGAQVLPIPVDGDGARTDVMADLVERTRPRLVYVTPHFHSPTGAVMPVARRRQIAEIADRAGVTVIEDLTLAEMALDDMTLPPPIAHFAATPSAGPPRATIHSIGSVSKILWAGLRVGWVRSPTSWTTRMLSTKTVADLGSPMLSQLVTSILFDDLDAIIAQRRQEMRPRRDLMCDRIAQQLPSWRVLRPSGGLTAWATLPEGNAVEFADLARQHGVGVVPGPSLSVDDGNRRSIRIVFARPEDVLVRGVDRLADAWGRYAGTDSRPSPRLLV